MSRPADAVQEYDTAAKVVIQRFLFRSVCSHSRRDQKNEWIIMSQYVFKLSSFRINYLATDKSNSLGKMEVLTKAKIYHDRFDYHLSERMNKYALFLQLCSNKWATFNRYRDREIYQMRTYNIHYKDSIHPD